MDDDKYSRYLSGDSDYGVKRPSKRIAKSLGGDSAKKFNLGLDFPKLKIRLGMGNFSSLQIALMIVVVTALCGLGLWYTSPAFRELIVGPAVQDSALIKTENEAGDSVFADDDTNDESSTAEVQGTSIFVYVTGAVENPNVYELKPDARAIDAVAAAGGLLKNAADAALNLAAPLEDGIQIHILTDKEFQEQGGTSAALFNTFNSANLSGPTGGVTAGDGKTRDGLVNINTADVVLLQTLPGIGPVTAEKIVADREKSGNYTSLDELSRVSGIGPKRVEALEGVASVGP